jgi:orotate phosphoribosyltransferase-like protein
MRLRGGDDQKGRKRIDIGKIMALKNAGWKIKDIADEMHMEPQAVSNAIWRYNKQNESENNY